MYSKNFTKNTPFCSPHLEPFEEEKKNNQQKPITPLKFHHPIILNESFI